MSMKSTAAVLGVVTCLLVIGLVMSPSAAGPEEGAATAEYKGSKACKSCHQDHFKAWLEMKHSKAFESLKPEQVAGGKDEKGQACVQCHTTGYGKGGFESVEKTPKLTNVGCESCHGAGSDHVKAQLNAMMTEEEVTDQKISKSVGCTQCHNPHISYKKLYGSE